MCKEFEKQKLYVCKLYELSTSTPKWEDELDANFLASKTQDQEGGRELVRRGDEAG